MERCEAVLEIVGDRAEALVVSTSGVTALTRFANSVIHQNVAEDSATTYVKLVVDGRAAAATTTQRDPEALTRLVERALEAARLRPPDPDWPGVAPAAPPVDVEHWDDDTADASPDDRAAVVKAFVDAGAGLEAAGYCSTTGVHVATATSAGQRLTGRHTSATINGIHRTGTSDAAAAATAVRLADLDGAAEGAAAAGRARASAEAIDLDPGPYEVVLSPSCLANMLQFLGSSGFNAKSHADGTSFVHLGEQQFDAAVSLRDDAADPRALGLLFDSEGTPKRRVDLVVDGVSTALVHDRRTAAKAGTRSTGHGVGIETAGAYPSNLFFEQGTGTADDLVARMERGLVVHDFWYTRILDPKTQVVTGLTRNGVFLVEDGRIGPAVRNLRFTQSFVSALGPGKVKAIAGDARVVGGMHVPTVHLASWNFTGGAKG